MQTRLISAARAAALLREQAASDRQLGARVATVKVWQSYRLSQTHADLLQSSRYRAAARFFIDDLYGSQKLAQRDAELARVIPTLNRFLPQAALATICRAVELDALSETLDHKVARQLRASGQPASAAESAPGLEPTIPGFDPLAYAAAYSQAGGFDERRQQIAAVAEIGYELDKLVRKPLLGGLLAGMGPAARAAGVGNMHEFLQRGFSAFKAMGGANEFLELVLMREQALAQALAQGDVSQLPTA